MPLKRMGVERMAIRSVLLRLLGAVALLVLTSLGTGPAFAQATFEILPFTSSTFDQNRDLDMLGLSADGQTVVGRERV